MAVKGLPSFITQEAAALRQNLGKLHDQATSKTPKIICTTREK